VEEGRSSICLRYRVNGQGQSRADLGTPTRGKNLRRNAAKESIRTRCRRPQIALADVSSSRRWTHVECAAPRGI